MMKAHTIGLRIVPLKWDEIWFSLSLPVCLYLSFSLYIWRVRSLEATLVPHQVSPVCSSLRAGSFGRVTISKSLAILYLCTECVDKEGGGWGEEEEDGGEGCLLKMILSVSLPLSLCVWSSPKSHRMLVFYGYAKEDMSVGKPDAVCMCVCIYIWAYVCVLIGLPLFWQPISPTVLCLVWESLVSCIWPNNHALYSPYNTNNELLPFHSLAFSKSLTTCKPFGGHLCPKHVKILWEHNAS